MLKLADIFQIEKSEISPTDIKVHFASHNGIEDPLFEVFLLGKWKEWQEGQNQHNFGRRFILSLIKTQKKHEWLFAGLFKVLKYEKKEKCYVYETEETPVLCEYIGRLFIYFNKSFRQPYPNYETVMDELEICRLIESRMERKKFEGYSSVFISFSELEHIINKGIEDWSAALSAVAGVYLITDKKSGKLYVGSAYGSRGILGRWENYASNGHGGNIELKKVLEEDPQSKSNFMYSILEIADIESSSEEIIKREQFWKEKLCSVSSGYNRN